MNIIPYIKAIDSQRLCVNSIIILKKGQKIAEHHWRHDQCRNVFSVSKSFTSIALGITIDEGKISLTDRIIDTFPDTVSILTPRLKTLTVEHLLTMSRGHPEFTRAQSIKEALSHKLVYDPGKVFVYDNTSTFLISAMITKITGIKVRDLLIEKLFHPLNIPDPLWQESEDGFTIGATGLELSAESLSIFGQFLLQHGSWNGKQLVSANWIDTATRTHITTNASYTKDKHNWELGYGYHFWICPYGAYRADGKNGQFVIIFPRQEVVITITSNDENMKAILFAVWDYILPQL